MEFDQAYQTEQEAQNYADYMNRVGYVAELRLGGGFLKWEVWSRKK